MKDSQRVVIFGERGLRLGDAMLSVARQLGSSSPEERRRGLAMLSRHVALLAWIEGFAKVSKLMQSDQIPFTPLFEGPPAVTDDELSMVAAIPAHVAELQSDPRFVTRARARRLTALWMQRSRTNLIIHAHLRGFGRRALWRNLAVAAVLAVPTLFVRSWWVWIPTGVVAAGALAGYVYLTGQLPQVE